MPCTGCLVRGTRNGCGPRSLESSKNTVNPLSRLHALTIMSAGQQTMNFCMNTGPTYMEPIARQLYQQIGLIEEEHVRHYESLVDPGESWWEQLVHHEYNECYLYHSFTERESDPTVKAIWEPHLNMELELELELKLEHLHIAADPMGRHDGREAAEACAPSPTCSRSSRTRHTYGV